MNASWRNRRPDRLLITVLARGFGDSGNVKDVIVTPDTITVTEEMHRRVEDFRNTVRKYLRADTVEPTFKLPERPSKLDAFADKLSAWLRVTRIGGLPMSLGQDLRDTSSPSNVRPCSPSATMRQKSGPQETAEKHVKDNRRKTRRKFSAEEKIRIVLEGLRGEHSIAELCRREGIAQG